MTFFIELIKGIFVGVANVIPGVSGGTMAVSFGIYDKILSSISNLLKDFKKSFKTLLPIAIGMVIGIIGFTFIIPVLLKNQPFITAIAFTGLILGGLPMIVKETKLGWQKDEKKSLIINLVIFATFAVFTIALAFAGGSKDSGVILTPNIETIIIMFFIGIIASATMIIPGVSGSLILMILGYYFGILTAIKDFLSALKDFDIKSMINQALILAPFGIGCLLGVFFISKLIKWLFAHFASATYSGILGLIITSPLSIFFKVHEEYNMTDTSAIQIIIGIVIFVICTAVTIFFGHLENKDAKN